MQRRLVACAFAVEGELVVGDQCGGCEREHEHGQEVALWSRADRRARHQSEHAGADAERVPFPLPFLPRDRSTTELVVVTIQQTPDSVEINCKTFTVNSEDINLIAKNSILHKGATKVDIDTLIASIKAPTVKLG